MTIAMLSLLVTGIFLARVGISQHGGDGLLAALGSVAIGVSVLWFLMQMLMLVGAVLSGPIAID